MCKIEREHEAAQERKKATEGISETIKKTGFAHGLVLFAKLNR